MPGPLALKARPWWAMLSALPSHPCSCVRAQTRPPALAPGAEEAACCLGWHRGEGLEGPFCTSPLPLSRGPPSGSRRCSTAVSDPLWGSGL